MCFKENKNFMSTSLVIDTAEFIYVINILLLYFEFMIILQRWHLSSTINSPNVPYWSRIKINYFEENLIQLLRDERTYQRYSYSLISISFNEAGGFLQEG